MTHRPHNTNRRGATRTAWAGTESLAQSEDRNEKRIDRLLRDAPEIADAIAKCNGERRSCNLPICAVCARRYRIWFTTQMLAIARGYDGPHEVATLHLAELAAGQLHLADLSRAHDRLRQRLNRAGLKGSVLLGGTEVTWQAQHDRWLLHLHLLAIGVESAQWRRLRESWPRDVADTPIRVDALNRGPRQLSYLQKFATFHRPGTRRHGGRGRAYPLPAARLVELARWWSTYRFEDFLFAYGARRRGPHIVIDE